MKKMMMVLLSAALFLSACAAKESEGLKNLRHELDSGKDNATIELILQDTSKDITPWLKNNIHNYNPAIMFVFVQRLINENAPLTEANFWYTAARYRAGAYLTICKYSSSGAEALFSSLSFGTRERLAYTFKDTPQWGDFIANADFFSHANTKRLKEWDMKNEVPANFCVEGDKFTDAERKQQLADFRKKYFKDFDEKSQPARNMNSAGAADKPAPLSKAEPAEVKPDPKEILYILSAISKSQERAKMVQGGYVKEFGMLDIEFNDDNNKSATGQKSVVRGFNIILSDNPNGWVVSAERSVPGQRVLIIVNTQKGLCCHNYDPGQCEILEIKETCVQVGLKIKPR